MRSMDTEDRAQAAPAPRTARLAAAVERDAEAASARLDTVFDALLGAAP